MPWLAPSPIDTRRWVLPVGTVIVAATAVVVVMAGPATLFEDVGTALAWVALDLAVLAPLAWLAARGRDGAGRALSAAAGFLALSYVVHSLPRVGVFTELAGNWQGKTLELVWLTVLLVVLARWAREDVGVRLPDRGTLGAPVGLIVGWFLLVAVSVVASGTDPFSDGIARGLLWDLAHPNLVEELLWRGVLLALLDRALGTPWRLWGAPVGWGIVLTSLGFGLGHGLVVTGDGLTFAPAQIVLTGFAGFLLAWVRARSGSVWLAYVAHCAPELGIAAGGAIVRLTA